MFHVLLVGALLVASGPARADDADDLRRATEALGVRHDPPGCADLARSLRDPAATLAAVVDGVTMPPWVPVRAARCAATLPQADADLRRWVADPARPGLVEIVLDALDGAAPDRVAAVARAALAGPHAARTRELLVHSSSAALRALAVGP